MNQKKGHQYGPSRPQPACLTAPSSSTTSSSRTSVSPRLQSPPSPICIILSLTTLHLGQLSATATTPNPSSLPSPASGPSPARSCTRAGGARPPSSTARLFWWWDRTPQVQTCRGSWQLGTKRWLASRCSRQGRSTSLCGRRAGTPGLMRGWRGRRESKSLPRLRVWKGRRST